MDSETRLALERIDREFALKQHKVFTVAPLKNEIPDGGHVYALLAGTMYIYMRHGDNRYRVALTLV